jgi:mannose-6-phosphate isomerase, class I
VEQLIGAPRNYAWGSTKSIPAFLGIPASDEPVAELWFGTHPTAPSHVKPLDFSGDDSSDDSCAQASEDESLGKMIADNPASTLGPSAQYAFGDRLPYLMKLIAPTAPLSLQVHPNKEQAEAGFQAEEKASIPLKSSDRVYVDSGHKPELLYAITEFRAFAGFAVRRKTRALLEGLDTQLAIKLSRRIALGRGMRPLVSWLLDDRDGPEVEQVIDFTDACQMRVGSGMSPAPLLDTMVSDLGKHWPGDPAAVVAFLMNPVVLQPGEALYLHPGTLHSYQSGLGLEVMASSDNVVRAGLTKKHVDRGQLLALGSFDAHPPLRIAPEKPNEHTLRFSAPVEDFELSVWSSDGEGGPLMGTGPRTLLCLQGKVNVACQKQGFDLERGQCLFVSDIDGPLVISGNGQVAQCSVP